jgi:hypothetical protein
MSEDSLASKMADRSEELVESIRPLLAGQGPVVQGAALADLVSMWIAGHNPASRDEALNDWLELVRNLVPINERKMFGDAGFPRAQ